VADRPDCDTPEAAIAAMVHAIYTVPSTAVGIGHSFGRRHSGQWYWNVRWTEWVGTGHRDRPVDAARIAVQAIADALAVVAKHTAEDEDAR
jgi:hypothetical protein